MQTYITAFKKDISDLEMRNRIAVSLGTVAFRVAGYFGSYKHPDIVLVKVVY